MVNQVTMCLIVQGDNTCVWATHGLDQGSKAFVLLIQAIVKENESWGQYVCRGAQCCVWFRAPFMFSKNDHGHR